MGYRPGMATLRSALVLAGFLLASFSAAAIGGFSTAAGVTTWYPTLAKPSWTPPPWLFGPAWTVLYASMGIAAWLVWRRAGGFAGARVALTLFFVQLAVNALWSVFFFGLRNPGLALADIAVLWCAIAATLVAFFRVSPAAGGLLVPYLAWVSFAAALNYAIWRLN
jgi:tryptophan-rich sensory protein